MLSHETLSFNTLCVNKNDGIFILLIELYLLVSGNLKYHDKI